MCADMVRMEVGGLEGHLPMVRIAVLYVVAYLYEHREQAVHQDAADGILDNADFKVLDVYAAEGSLQPFADLVAGLVDRQMEKYIEIS